MPDVLAVYREVARVTVAGGLYISQHKQPTSLQASVEPSPRGYELIEPYYRRGPLPPVEGSPHREAGTLEFLHRWEELLGGMCRAGFAIEDLLEPVHADEQARDRQLWPSQPLRRPLCAHQGPPRGVGKYPQAAAKWRAVRGTPALGSIWDALSRFADQTSVSRTRARLDRALQSAGRLDQDRRRIRPPIQTPARNESRGSSCPCRIQRFRKSWRSSASPWPATPRST